MKMKRFLSLLLALTLTVGLLPLSAASAELDSATETEPDSSLCEPVSASPEAAEPEAAAPAVRTPATKAVTASGTCGENLTWTLTDDGTLTISGTGAMTDYYNSPAGEHAPLEAPWYSSCLSIARVTINEGVTSIGSYAFIDGENLTDITIPDSITDIGESAFHGCSKLIEVENGVSYVDRWAVGCDESVTKAVLRSDTVGIGEGVFGGCISLTGITIGNCVTKIGGLAFIDCEGLTDITIPDSVTSIGGWAFKGCISLTNVTIGSGVTSIGDYAFSSCRSLTDIIFVGTVPPSIDSAAFYDVTATAYYPGGELWTEDVRQDYGGNLTWVEYNSELAGDVDRNGEVNILDVMSIINIITGTLQPTDTQYARADLNGDGTVNILDAMALINQITGACPIQKPSAVISWQRVFCKYDRGESPGSCPAN